MFQKLLDLYEVSLVKLFGYKNAVRVEELAYGLGMIFIGMIFIGMMIMAFVSAFFILRLHSLEDFGESQVKILRVDNGKKSTQIISIRRNIKEAFEQLLLLSFSPFFTIKRFTARDERRTKRFLRIMLVIMVIVILFAIVSSWTVLEPL